VTAEDVAFTYEFLQDTSLGTTESPVPTPTFRGRVSAVETATAIDETTVRLTLDGVNDAVGMRALQVPILPKHVWGSGPIWRRSPDSSSTRRRPRPW